ncbi:MFS transporter [Actinomadura rupiterrae]|uniref:MFS transporter n=1 Tax=Actinomadura rupiterrae TaxID=559627 RepID=UPI0020A526C6|nr:MFS transporter [Actinomadura rupiterrae]MCP2343031.1 putative MFS family arabinose efflux permease [Actinomadura rupiterrae]
MSVQDVPVRAGTRPTIFTRAFLGLLWCSLGGMASCYLLMSTLPLFVARHGGGGFGAGLSTGVMMLATVLLEPLVPRLASRFGYRATLAGGLVLMGLPSALPLLSGALPAVLLACALRGAGLGVLVVAGTALAAESVAPSRRGEALGVYGVAVGLPALSCLPIGIWLSGHAGFGPVFVAAVVVALVPLTVLGMLPGVRCEDDPTEHGGLLAAARRPDLARPALVFAAVTFATGVLQTFVPLAVHGATAGLAAGALFAQSAATPLTRWLSGRYADRYGARHLLVPMVLLTAAGAGTLVWTGAPVAVIVGPLLFGAGFGIAQTSTLALMFDRVTRPEFGRVSALWNVAYDAGMGVGAVGFGIVVSVASYAGGFALVAGLLALNLAPVLLDRRRSR